MRKVLALSAVITATTLLACASDTPEADDNAATSTDEDLRSAPLGDSDMVPIATPGGMPKPWDQPDSTGYFEEHGKCGPTALANELLLYGISKTPETLYDQGVQFVVGTLPWEIEGWIQKYDQQLGCSIQYPADGSAEIRQQVDSGHPVMVWFNTEGGWSSHWVTVVGHHGTGANEFAVVMSWGRYYKIAMSKLDDASKWVYGLRHPRVECTTSTKLVVKYSP